MVFTNSRSSYVEEDQTLYLCHRCSGRDSDAYDSDSTETLDSSDEEEDSASETDWYERQQPVQLGDYPSVVELQRLLQEQCPKEYAALPKSGVLNFEDWQDGLAQKRLCIGSIRKPDDSVSQNVYAFLHGNNSNRIGLCYGVENKPLPLVKASNFNLNVPFRSICTGGRLAYDGDTQRLRALLCFWFFAGGHLLTLKNYRSFETHLVEAVQSLGRTVIK